MKSDNSLLQVRLAAIAHRKALEADVVQGVEVERVTRSHKLKKACVRFNDRRNGVEFTPPAKKAGTSAILFSDVTHVRKLPPKSTLHKKVGMGPFKHCLEVSSRSGVVWHLVVGTDMDLTAWHDLLVFHAAHHRASRRSDPMRSLIENRWAATKKRQADSASFAEVVDILHRTFGDIPAPVVEERFCLFDKDKNVRLDFEEFSALFRSFCDYPELRPLFAGLTRNPEAGMTRAEFADFLCGQGDLGEISSNSGTFARPAGESLPSVTASGLQLSPSDSTYAHSLFDSFGFSSEEHLSFEEFAEYLVSAQFNSALDPRHRRCADAMDLPLNNYFINSSHNTYLTGDQLRSNSSTDQYRDVLLAGCRCVEIDCWNGPSGDPIVYHGHTATSKIRFEDVIRVIGEYAFKSPSSGGGVDGRHGAGGEADGGDWNPRLFPIILSLEVHTSDSQSATMARMLRNVLGNKLLLPADVRSHEELSPAGLKGKILVKWKANSEDDDDAKDISGSGIRPDRAEGVSAQQQQQHASGELSACVTIGSFKTQTWGTDAVAPTCVQSYVESAIDNFYANYPMEFTMQNTRMLSRVYPAGRRVNSSNYDPAVSWRLGAHMVALNFQTRDRYMAVNNGFFAFQNGGCGYVLKPTHLRDPSLSRAALTEASRPFRLTVKFICGAHLGEAYTGHRDTLLHVRAWLHGRDNEEYATPSAVANSFHTVWNETTTLRGGHYDLDVLCLRLFASLSSGDDSKHEAGHVSVPVRVLRSGYRAIPLLHPKTDFPFDFATLVCQIAVDVE